MMLSKKPVFELSAPRAITRAISAYHLMACLSRFHSKCLHSLLAFGMVYKVKAILDQFASLEPRKTLN